MSDTTNEGLAAIRERMRSEGVRLVQVEVPDLDGGLRGKLLALDKGLSDEIGWSNIIYGLTAADDVYVSPFSSYENGFADVFGQPDTATVRRLPWRPDTVAVVIDVHDPDGTMTPEGPRTMLRRAVDKATAMGFQPRFAVEYEVFIYYADDAASPPSPATLTPVSRTRNAYSLVRLPALRALFETFMQRMEAVGTQVVSMHTELGHGAIEFALAHAPPLAAADGAVRAKTYLKEVCAERGMVATFMAKLDADLPGSGGMFIRACGGTARMCSGAVRARARPRGSTPPASSSICRRSWRSACPTSTRSGAGIGSTGCPRTHPGAMTTVVRRSG